MIQNQMTALFTHACNIYNLTSNPCRKVNFFEIYKTLLAWLFLFLECRFIILYINFTTKNKTTFDKIFSQKIFYIPKILQKKISLSHKK